MKQKDITEKLLEDYEDVFADIVNVLLFNGKRLISPEALTLSNAKSHYKSADNKLHEQERDVMKLWKDKGVNIAIYGIENQTKAEKVMPLRILSYDGASYRAQLLRGASGRLCPVVTIVLYFGWKAHWNQPKTLKKVLRIPAELDTYVNDYQIHVFEVAWLSDQKVSMFKSDFHIVADFFTQLRKNNNYVPSDTKIKHVDEVLKMLAVFGHTPQFEKLVATKKSKEVHTMCEAINNIEQVAKFLGIEQGIQQGIEQGIQQGIEQGIQQGIEQGIQQGIDHERHSQIEQMLKKGKTPEEIADFCSYTIDEILNVQNVLLSTV